MKLILFTFLIAFNVHADEIVFIKTNHFNQYKALENLQSQNNDFAAIQSLKHLLDTDPQNEIYILDQLSKLYATHGLSERYISFLNTKINKFPFSVNLNYQLAKEYLATEKAEQACEKAKFMLAHVSHKENFYLLLSDCSLATNHPDEAVAYLDKYINGQSNAALYLKRAEVHLKLNNLSLAKADLDFYFLKAKATEKTYLLQAELFTKQQYSEKLPELYRRCLETVEVSPSCFLGYLTSAQNINTPFKVEHFNKHSATYQTYPAVIIEIGRYYQQIKNFDQAEKMYLSVYDKNPEKIESVILLFELYNQQNQSQKAYDLLNRFIANTENSTDIQVAKNLQSSLFQKGNSEILATQPSSPSGQTQITTTTESRQYLYLAKKYSEILLSLKKIKSKSDSDYFLLGNIYYHLNSYGNAKLNWNKVKRSSHLYHKAIFNTTVVMRIESMTTVANKLFKTTDFPPDMYAQTQKLTTLLGEASKRLPADEKKKTDEQLKALLYLDWEP